MSEKIYIKEITLPIKDDTTGETEDVTYSLVQMEDINDVLGLSVVNGMLCVTYEE